MSDDHSKVVPLLPIPNRTVKRFCANDSAGSRVKVGHRQTLTASKCPTQLIPSGAFVFLAVSRNMGSMKSKIRLERRFALYLAPGFSEYAGFGRFILMD